ncbi:MAG TPA: ATP-binding cassette domain-containing protein, partial [Bellilinea sp.]|nr:ATP-binding cassette domain-containing protein [Bellilinea sp.]
HVQGIGVVFGQRSQLWWDVPVADSFDLLKDIYRTDEAVFRRNLDELVSALDLGTILQQPTRTLSLGQRMRCELAASLLHSPSILFLDEPTIGLDARNKLAVREFIRGQNQRHGTTVLLTTHDTQDIEALTERILLLGKGQLLLDGNIQALKKNLSGIRRLTVFHEGDIGILPPGVQIGEKRLGQTRLLIDTQQIPISEAIAKVAQLVQVQDLTVEGVSAEELILSLYKEYTL